MIAWHRVIEWLDKKCKNAGSPGDGRLTNWILKYSESDVLAFGKEVMDSPGDTEALSWDDCAEELRLLCWSAIGAAPTSAAVSAAMARQAEVLEPSRFLAMTIARSLAMDEVLGPVLAKRVRMHVDATSRGEESSPAPSNVEWRALAEECLQAKGELVELRRPGGSQAGSIFSVRDFRLPKGRQSKKQEVGGPFVYVLGPPLTKSKSSFWLGSPGQRL